MRSEDQPAIEPAEAPTATVSAASVQATPASTPAGGWSFLDSQTLTFIGLGIVALVVIQMVLRAKGRRGDDGGSGDEFARAARRLSSRLEREGVPLPAGVTLTPPTDLAEADRRTAQLRRLIDEADERIAELRALTGGPVRGGAEAGTGPSRAGPSQAGPSRAGPAARADVLPMEPDPLTRRVLALAREGESPERIAQRVGVPRSFVDLALAARPVA